MSLNKDTFPKGNNSERYKDEPESVLEAELARFVDKVVEDGIKKIEVRLRSVAEREFLKASEKYNEGLTNISKAETEGEIRPEDAQKIMAEAEQSLKDKIKRIEDQLETTVKLM